MSCTFPYNFYKLIETNNTGFICKQIILCISLIGKGITYDQNYIKKYANNELPNISLASFNSTINDEDFNNLYWVLFNDQTGRSSLTITNTLQPLKKNGTPTYR